MSYTKLFVHDLLYGKISNDDDEKEEEVDSRQTTLSLPPSLTDIVQRQPRGRDDYVCFLFYHI